MTAPPRTDLVEILHGVAVADPFRPLEDVDAPATIAWASAQNARTRAVPRCAAGACGGAFLLRQAMDYQRLGVPERFGDAWFAWRQRGLEAQGMLVWRRETDSEWRIAIDPNGLSADGTVALSGTFTSLDGRRVAYLTSTAGSDWQSLRVRDLDSGADLPDALEKCRFTSVAWHPDGSGFLYSKPIDAAASNAPQQLRHQLFWHRLGDPQDKDTLVFDLPDQPQAILSPYRSLDGKFFFCIAQAGSDRNNGVYVRPVGGGAFAELFPMGKAQFYPRRADRRNVVRADGRGCPQPQADRLRARCAHAMDDDRAGEPRQSGRLACRGRAHRADRDGRRRDAAGERAAGRQRPARDRGAGAVERRDHLGRRQVRLVAHRALRVHAAAGALPARPATPQLVLERGSDATLDVSTSR